jgi:two-component system chemotaxis response regulator CheY
MATHTIDKLSILLVEPSTAQQKIIDGFLRRLGVVQIRTVQTAQAALEALRQSTPDIVISAMHLPDRTGTELLEAIRYGTVKPDIPYMLISSETNYRYLEPIRQAGAIAILPKPFVLEQLRTALYAALDYLDPGMLHTPHVAHEDLKVLLVDDSSLARRHIQRVLAAMGIEHITEAENGQQAFELVQRSYFDLIVTDLYMPQMDGKEFVEQVRQHSNQPSVPILMVSSESDASRLAVVQQAGVSAMIDKPFETGTIKRLIEQLLAV